MVDEILKATSMSQLALEGEGTAETFRRIARDVHPDVCQDPRAGEAFARLVDLRDSKPVKGVGLVTFHLPTGDLIAVSRHELADYVDFPLNEPADGSKEPHQWMRVWKQPSKTLQKAEAKGFSGLGIWGAEALATTAVPASGGRRLPATLYQVSADAGRLMLGSDVVSKVSVEHCAWMFRRGLEVARRTENEVDLSGNRWVVGPLSRAFIIVDYAKAATSGVDSLVDAFTDSAMSTHSQTRAFLKGCRIGSPDPLSLLAEFNALLERVFGGRRYVELVAPVPTWHGQA